MGSHLKVLTLVRHGHQNSIAGLLAGGMHPQCQPSPQLHGGNFCAQKFKWLDAYMSALGVGFLTRTVACALTPTATNKQNSNGQITIDTSSTFRSTSVTFELNRPFKETTADGRTVETTAVLQGNKLIKTQKAQNRGELTTIETREFVDSNTMNLIHTMPSNSKIFSKRVYKRQ